MIRRIYFYFGTILILVSVLFTIIWFFTNKTSEDTYTYTKPDIDLSNYSVATFAGGCFWCVEADFEKIEGVVEVISGYSGGKIKNPTYEQVASGSTRHLETVQVYYDPKVINYEDLLQRFWRLIDPTDTNGQFIDRGPQYKTAIFYNTQEEKRLAEKTKKELEKMEKFNKPLATEIRELENFYKAEEYHQDYYKKAELRYKLYRRSSGRDQFLNKFWSN